MNGRSKSVVMAVALAMAVGLVAEAGGSRRKTTKRRTSKQRVSRTTTRNRATRRVTTGRLKPGGRKLYDSPGDDIFVGKGSVTRKRGKPSLYDSPGDDTYKPGRLRYDSPGNDKFASGKRSLNDSDGDDTMAGKPTVVVGKPTGGKPKGAAGAASRRSLLLPAVQAAREAGR